MKFEPQFRGILVQQSMNLSIKIGQESKLRTKCPKCFWCLVSCFSANQQWKDQEGGSLFSFNSTGWCWRSCPALNTGPCLLRFAFHKLSSSSPSEDPWSDSHSTFIKFEIWNHIVQSISIWIFWCPSQSLTWMSRDISMFHHLKIACILWAAWVTMPQCHNCTLVSCCKSCFHLHFLPFF